MFKKGDKNIEQKIKEIKKVLITQPKPEGDKSPYFDLAKKHNIELHFHPFIIVDGIPGRDQLIAPAVIHQQLAAALIEG